MCDARAHWNHRARSSLLGPSIKCIKGCVSPLIGIWPLIGGMAYLLVPLPHLPQVVDVQLRLHVLLPVERDEGNLEAENQPHDASG